MMEHSTGPNTYRYGRVKIIGPTLLRRSSNYEKQGQRERTVCVAGRGAGDTGPNGQEVMRLEKVTQ
jgi:hypothetical protein